MRPLLVCVVIVLSVGSAWADAADRAARYLMSIQEETGFFRYEYDFVTRTWSDDDNIVRQAGTASALAAYAVDRGDSRAAAAARAALAALHRMSIPHGSGMIVSADGTPDGAKTGATALALLASALVDVDAARREAWMRGLLALQRSDGRFRRSPTNREASGYYDGESWFALAVLDARHRGVVPPTALAAVDTGMLRYYGPREEISFFHWGQLAAAARHATTRDPELRAFAEAQSAAFIERLRPEASRNSSSCYQLEGLAASYLLLGEAPKLQARVRDRLYRDVWHNTRLQISRWDSEFEDDGVVVSGRALAGFDGAFMNGVRRLQTRIDTTQHCLAAFLQVENLGLRLR